MFHTHCPLTAFVNFVVFDEQKEEEEVKRTLQPMPGFYCWVHVLCNN